jgi:enoyl-CoA hydratase/carnithine racemase
VSTIGPSPSSNGRAHAAWSESWTHLSIDRRSPGYCRVTFEHPPINRVTGTTVAELAEIVELIEADQDLKVVVFTSANREFYLVGHEREEDARRAPALGGGLGANHAWPELLARLSRAPVISIASIRGQTRGPGSEFLLACDLRFASRECALLAQPEIGVSAVPDETRAAILSRLVGRGRALELLLVSDDLDGPRAELYGYVNRVIADEDLDDEVDQIALRVAHYDQAVIRETKSCLDRVTMPAAMLVARVDPPIQTTPGGLS